MGEPSGNNGTQITLYTNVFSPFAHRVQIALDELGLKYEEVEVDLNAKTDDFLKANPRGLVPALTFNQPSTGQPRNIIESIPIVHFLLDTYPHLSQDLWPASTDAQTAYFRYRVNLFIDTFFTKVEQPQWFKLVFASGTEQVHERVDDMVAAIQEHVEPLLEDAKPFFGGRSRMTLAEVLIAPAVMRLYGFANGQLLPESLAEKLNQLPNFSKWASATMSRQSVKCKWDGELQGKLALDILPKARLKYGPGVQ